MIKVKHIPNIMSKKGRSEWEREYSFDSVAGYVPERYADGHRVIHSRHGVVLKADWPTTVMRSGDEIIITPEVKWEALAIAGAWIYSAAQTVALWVAMNWQGVLLFAASAGSAVYASVAARNYKSDRDSSSWEESPTYGWDGARTMADTELPVGIIYGKVKAGGNIISSYIEAVDDSNYLNILIGLSEGPVESIGGITTSTDYADISAIGDLIKINGNPIENYQDVNVFIRMGEDVQAIIPGFDQLQEEFDLTASAIELLKDAPYTYTTTNDDVDSVVVSLNLPNGLHKYKVEASGYKSWYAFYRVEYKLSSDAGWTEVEQTFPRGQGDGQDERAYRQYTEGGYGAQPSGTSWPDVMPVGDGAIFGKTTSVLRRQFTLDFPGPGKYDIRLTRTSANSSSGEPETGSKLVSNLYVKAINERRALTLTYPYTALLGLNILATDQLSGSFPNVLTEIEGMKLTDWNGGPTYSNNPMSVIWDLLTNERYGAGLYIEAANMDAVLAQEDADYCDEQVFINGIAGAEEDRFHMDIVIDGYRRGMDLLIDLCSSFRAFPVYSDGAIRIIIDKEETPVQTFGMGNIEMASFTESFASIKIRSNRVQIQFIDGDRDYQRDTVEENDDASLTAGEPIRDNTMFMPSITRQGQALRIARYMLKLNILSTRTIGFKASIDAVTSQVGDVINFAHDVPQWGLASGRVKSGAVSTITLKDTVTVPAVASGESVVIQIRHNDDDSIEEQDITSSPGHYVAGTTLSIAPATFDSPPAAYDVFVLGTSTMVTKPFRILQMTRENDYSVSITGVEYDEDIYDESNLLPPADQFSFLPDPRRTPLPVENLVAKQNFSYQPHVLINFDIAEADSDYGFWDHGEVHLGTFDEDDLTLGPTFEIIGSSRSEPYPIYDLTAGRTYRVRVVSVSKWGIRENLIDAATVDFVVGDPSEYGLPPIVKGLEVVNQGNDVEFRSADLIVEWRPARSFETAANPAGTEPLGAGQGQEDWWFRDYKVVITTRNAVRRTVFTKDSKFTYTRQMNYEDNREFHETDYLQSPVAKLIEVQVWVRDVFNQLSARSARLLVDNPRPEPIGGWALAVRPPATSADYFSEVEDLGSGMYRLSWQQAQESDAAGYAIYRRLNSDVPMDDTDGQPVDDTYFYLNSDSAAINEALGDGDAYHYVIAPYDTFDRTLLNFRRKFTVSYTASVGVTLVENVIWAQSDEPDIPRY